MCTVLNQAYNVFPSIYCIYNLFALHLSHTDSEGFQGRFDEGIYAVVGYIVTGYRSSTRGGRGITRVERVFEVR
jgi:hypothetical protein